MSTFVRNQQNQIMKLTSLKPTFVLLSLLYFSACSNNASTGETAIEEVNIEQTEASGNETTAPESEAEIKEDKASLFGNFDGLIGKWTVDAATAGVKMDLTFNEDGSFKQVMGTINQTGTWEVVDDTHVKVTTPNTKGQTWLITELTDASVNICWNPDSPKPKTIPMRRVN